MSEASFFYFFFLLLLLGSNLSSCSAETHLDRVLMRTSLFKNIKPSRVAPGAERTITYGESSIIKEKNF